MAGPITTYHRSRSIMVAGLLVGLVGLVGFVVGAGADPVMDLTGVHALDPVRRKAQAVGSLGALVAFLGAVTMGAGLLYRSLGRTY